MTDKPLIIPDVLINNHINMHECEKRVINIIKNIPISDLIKNVISHILNEASKGNKPLSIEAQGLIKFLTSCVSYKSSSNHDDRAPDFRVKNNKWILWVHYSMMYCQDNLTKYPDYIKNFDELNAKSRNHVAEAINDMFKKFTCDITIKIKGIDVQVRFHDDWSPFDADYNINDDYDAYVSMYMYN